MSIREDVPRLHSPDIRFDPRFPSKVLNTPASEEIAKHTERFLASGGSIKQIPYGVSGIDMDNLKRSFTVKSSKV